jgi:predicted RNA-binding protein with RPS1 domain
LIIIKDLHHTETMKCSEARIILSIAVIASVVQGSTAFLAQHSSPSLHANVGSRLLTKQRPQLNHQQETKSNGNFMSTTEVAQVETKKKQKVINNTNDDSGSTPKRKNNKRKNKRNKNKNNKMKNKNTKNTKNTKNNDKEPTVITNQKLLPLTDLKLGAKVDGYVAAFTSFGIFIKTKYDFKNKGANGYALLHKSQIRDEPVDDLSKLFRVGARVMGLRVIKINYAKGEVGLSLRKQRGSRLDMKDISVGQEVEGTVARVVKYGAFIDIGANINPLVHISRISQKKITNIRQAINEGDKVQIHILSKDIEKKTMSASMLDQDADEYLDRRSEQMKKMRESVKMENLRTELEYFEDAVRELEESLEA